MTDVPAWRRFRAVPSLEREPPLPARLVAQVLDVWRDIERLLDSLPPDDPQVSRVMDQSDELARTYRRLTTTAGGSEDVLRATRGTILSSRALLHGVNSRARGQ